MFLEYGIQEYEEKVNKQEEVMKYNIEEYWTYQLDR